MFYCHGGQHRFSEMSYSNLINKKGTEKEYRQTFKLIKYGLSSEQIADVLEKDPRTIEAWVKAIAERSKNFHNFVCLLIGITIEFLQMDELWSYLKNKKRQLWIFIGLESRTKFWVNFELGSRTNHTNLEIVVSEIIAIAIKCSSPGAIFFRQERIGLHGKAFKMWKFRTMVANAAKMQAQLETQNQTSDGVMFKIKHDPRITPVGHFLRQTSLDELPQLFNILLGQMSLVGPRPLPIRDVARMESWHHIRHQVLPGITGLWQISGRSDIDDFDDAARLDLYYIDNWSLNLDIDILIETLRIFLFSKGAY